MSAVEGGVILLGFGQEISFGLAIRSLVARAEGCRELAETAPEPRVRTLSPRLGTSCLRAIPWLIEKLVCEDSVRDSFGISHGLLLVAGRLRQALGRSAEPTAGSLCSDIASAKILLGQLHLPVARPARWRVGAPALGGATPPRRRSRSNSEERVPHEAPNHPVPSPVAKQLTWAVVEA